MNGDFAGMRGKQARRNIEPPTVMFLHHATDLGGAEISLFELVKGLGKHRNVRVVLPDRGTLYQLLRPVVDVEIVPVQAMQRTGNPLKLARYAANLLRSFVQVLRLIRRYRVDIIHANSLQACLYALLPAYLSGTRIVWHVRDVGRPFLVRWMCARYSSHVICVSDFVARGINLPKHKKTVIYNGVDTGPEAENTRPQANCQARRLGMVAQYVPWKNHKGFIDMAAKLLEDREDYQFVLVGGCFNEKAREYKRELMAYTRQLGLENKIEFLSFQYDITAFMKGLDLLVHPTAVEPFGRILIEAMANDVPVIACGCGGPGEIVEDGLSGVLCPDDDPEQLYRSVKKLMDDEEMQHRVRAGGRERVRRLFSSARHAAQIDAVYSQLLNT